MATEAANRLATIVEAAERAAEQVIDDAERQARGRLEEAEAEARGLAAARMAEVEEAAALISAQAEEVKRQALRLAEVADRARDDLAASASAPLEPLPVTPHLTAVPAEGDEPAPEEDGASDPEPEAVQPPPPVAERGTPAGARLLATQMAVSGSSREDIEQRLREGFDLEDTDAVLDAILGPEE